MQIASLYQLFLDSKGICTDTRKIENDTIFFALKGDNFNGNDFAANALKQGCSFAIIDEDEFKINDKCILVENVLSTLQQLANHHRKQFDIPVLGITGSNGKTTTKELIGAVLSKKFNCLITEGNLNNHLGVPFTLLKLTTEHEFAVIEMGASYPGDIQELVEIAEPNYGIITNIGAAHIEGFGSLEGVVETKTALYIWVDAMQGVVFYNAEDSTLTNRLPNVESFSYGLNKGDVKGGIHEMTPLIHFKWTVGDYQSPVLQTNLVGGYNSSNMTAAVCIGNYFKVDKADICEAITSYAPSNNRSQIQDTARNTLIVDCYNANPASMDAAISNFIDIKHPNKLVILGDMLELGHISEVEHQLTVDTVTQNLDNFILVGEEFQKTVGPSARKYSTWEDVVKNEALSNLEDYLILLKGSRGVKLESLISHL